MTSSSSKARASCRVARAAGLPARRRSRCRRGGARGGLVDVGALEHLRGRDGLRLGGAGRGRRRLAFGLRALESGAVAHVGAGQLAVEVEDALGGPARHDDGRERGLRDDAHDDQVVAHAAADHRDDLADARRPVAGERGAQQGLGRVFVRERPSGRDAFVHEVAIRRHAADTDLLDDPVGSTDGRIALDVAIPRRDPLVRQDLVHLIRCERHLEGDDRFPAEAQGLVFRPSLPRRERRQGTPAARRSGSLVRALLPSEDGRADGRFGLLTARIDQRLLPSKSVIDKLARSTPSRQRTLIEYIFLPSGPVPQP